MFDGFGPILSSSLPERVWGRLRINKLSCGNRFRFVLALMLCAYFGAPVAAMPSADVVGWN